MNAYFTSTVFEKFLFKEISVSVFCPAGHTCSAQQVKRPERVKFSNQTIKKVQLLLKLLESDDGTKLGGFEWFLLVFILFNPFGTGKFEKFNFSDPKITKTPIFSYLQFFPSLTKGPQLQSLST